MGLSLHPEFLKQSRNRRYLLAISGGRDSVALLHLLLEAGYKQLILCHLNHGLRGKASGQDAAFVRRLAKKHDLPCEIDRVDVNRLMKVNGESMELAARNVRLKFYRDCANKYRCPRVLLAHHADDQVETILFNLFRGSSGLKGMKCCVTHRVRNTRIELTRPLLMITRAEIDHYLTRNTLKYREDTSNAEAIATRNRLRNEAIPLLSEIMSRDIVPAILRAEAMAQARENCLEEVLTPLDVYDPQGRLFLPKLAKLSPTLQSMVLHRYLKGAGIRDISHDLLVRSTSLITDLSVAKINLPGGKFLRRKEKRIFIS